MSETLRGCPHCGPRTEVDVNSIQLVCLSCGLHGPVTAGQGEDCTAAIAAWNSLPRHPQWTTEPPTEPGWYWRQQGHCIPTIVKVTDRNFGRGEKCLAVDGETREYFLTCNAQWAGPIPEPEAKQ